MQKNIYFPPEKEISTSKKVTKQITHAEFVRKLKIIGELVKPFLEVRLRDHQINFFLDLNKAYNINVLPLRVDKEELYFNFIQNNFFKNDPEFKNLKESKEVANVKQKLRDGKNLEEINTEKKEFEFLRYPKNLFEYFKYQIFTHLSGKVEKIMKKLLSSFEFHELRKSGEDSEAFDEGVLKFLRSHFLILNSCHTDFGQSDFLTDYKKLTNITEDDYLKDKEIINFGDKFKGNIFLHFFLNDICPNIDLPKQKFDLIKLAIGCFDLQFFKVSPKCLKLEKHYIYTWSPIDRQALRKLNRRTMGLDNSKSATENNNSMNLSLLIRNLLSNNKILGDLDRDHFDSEYLNAETNTYHKYEEHSIPHAMLIMIIHIFELGLVDSDICESVFLSLCEFSNKMQNKFSEFLNDLTGKEEEEEQKALERIKISFIILRKLIIDVLLHAICVFNDEAFEAASASNKYNKEGKLRYLFHHQKRMKSVSHVFVKFGAFIEFNDDIVNILARVTLDSLKDYQRDCVTIMTYFNDTKYDCFINNFNSLVAKNYVQNQIGLGPTKQGSNEIDVRKKAEDLVNLVIDQSRLILKNDIGNALEIFQEYFKKHKKEKDLKNAINDFRKVLKQIKKNFPDGNENSGKTNYDSEVETLLKDTEKLEKWVTEFFRDNNKNWSNKEKQVKELLANVAKKWTEKFKEFAKKIFNQIVDDMKSIIEIQKGEAESFLKDYQIPDNFQINRKYLEYLEILKGFNFVEHVATWLCHYWRYWHDMFKDDTVFKSNARMILIALAKIMKLDIMWGSVIFSDNSIQEAKSILIARSMTKPIDFLNYGHEREKYELIGYDLKSGSWALLALFEPALFSEFIKFLFMGKIPKAEQEHKFFEIFLIEKNNFIGLLEYFKIILNHLHRNIKSFYTEFQKPDDKNEEGHPETENQNDDYLVTMNFYIKRLEEGSQGLYHFLRLIKKVLKELKDRMVLSLGQHYFIRTGQLIYKIVEDVFFVKERNYWNYFFEKIANPKKSPQIAKNKIPSAQKLKIELFRLLNVCNSVYWKSKHMAVIKANFNHFASPYFENNIELETIKTRRLYFNMYSNFFNFEKKTCYDEFVLMVNNPDITDIINKFKEEDFDSIYKFDNIAFLIEELKHLVHALETLPLNDEPFNDEGNKIPEIDPLDPQKSKSPKEMIASYLWELVIPEVYKLFKGLLSSYYTKIKNKDFDYFVGQVEILSKLTIKTGEFFNKKIFNGLSGDSGNEEIKFQTEQIASNSDPEAILLREFKMFELSLIINRGLEKIYLLYQQNFEYYKVKGLNEAQYKLLKKIVSYFYKKIWPLERISEQLSGSRIKSFSKFYEHTRSNIPWKSDELFMSIMGHRVKDENNKVARWNPFIKWRVSYKNMWHLNQKKIEKNRKANQESTKKFNNDSGICKKPSEIEHPKSTIIDKYLENPDPNHLKKKNILEDSRIPEKYRFAMNTYIENKNTDSYKDSLKQLWEELMYPIELGQNFETAKNDTNYLEFVDKFDISEKNQNRTRFGFFLVSFSFLANSYVGHIVDLALGTMDVEYLQFMLNMEYYLTTILGIKEKCDDVIKAFNDHQRKERSDKTKIKPNLRFTFHESLYEVYFNLLNLMYWRNNDQQFTDFFNRFKVINQVLRSVSNVEESSNGAKDKELSVKNPIGQIIRVLKYFTENSRIYRNYEWELVYSDRKEDLPLMTILLNNVAFLVKSMKKGNPNVDPTYFAFLNQIFMRRIYQSDSEIYSLHLSGINVIQSFLEKEDIIKSNAIWKSLDHSKLYKQMIWLVKFWFSFDKVKRKFQTFSKGSRDIHHDTDHNHNAPTDESLSNRPNKERIILEKENSKLEEYLNEDLVTNFDVLGLWLTRGSWWKIKSSTVSNFSRMMNLDYYFGTDSHLFSYDSPFITNLMNKYLKIDEEKELVNDEPVKVAIEIYIMLRNLSRTVPPVNLFMKQKFEEASKFKAFRNSILDPVSKEKIAEFKVLLFLSTVVRNIEVVREHQNEKKLVTIYFRSVPISNLKNNLGYQEFLNEYPIEDTNKQRAYLLESIEDTVTEGKIYQDLSNKYMGLPSIFARRDLLFMFRFLSTWILTTLINILLIVYLLKPAKEGDAFEYLDNGAMVVFGVKIAYVVVCSLWLILSVVRFGLIQFSKASEQIVKKLSKAKEDLMFKGKWIKRLEVAGDFLSLILSNFWYPMSITLFAYLGAFVNEVFWAIAFLIVVLEFRSFRYIFDSLWKDLGRLGLLFLFLLFIIFIAIYITFVNFSTDDDQEDIKTNCGDFTSCFFNIFSVGYRGSIGDILKAVSVAGEKNFWIIFFFTLIYFLIVKQIIFNIVFGIIQDNFGDAREETQNAENRNNYCKICDLDSIALDRRNKDFNDHITSAHALKNYQDYLIYLDQLPHGRLTQFDLEIKKKNEKSNFDWMPISDTLDHPIQIKEYSEPKEE
jgi:hypothetical protein